MHKHSNVPLSIALNFYFHANNEKVCKHYAFTQFFNGFKLKKCNNNTKRDDMFVDWQSDFGMAFVSNDMIQLLYDSKFPNVS